MCDFSLSLATKRPKVNEFELIEVEWKSSRHNKIKFKDKKNQTNGV